MNLMNIHESDAKSNNDKNEVADETIEKILPNLENENQTQDWQCAICKKEFTDKRKFTEHVLAVHRGKKPFKCDICGKHVRHQKTLINHIRRVHTGMKPYQCSVCNQKCASQSNLNEHISSFHSLDEAIGSEDQISQVNEFYFE